MPRALPNGIRVHLSLTRSREPGKSFARRYEIQGVEQSTAGFLRDELSRYYTLLRLGQEEVARRFRKEEVLGLARRHGELYTYGDGRNYLGLPEHLRREAEVARSSGEEAQARELDRLAQAVGELSPLGVFALADLMGRLHSLGNEALLEELAPPYRRGKATEPA